MPLARQLRRIALAGFCFAATEWTALAQQPGGTTAQDPSVEADDPFQDALQDEELPEVTVRGDQPVGTAPAGDVATDPFDLPLSFPGLRQLEFEGLNGATRGTTSVYDFPGLATIIDRNELTERMPQDMFQALQNEVGVLVQRTARGHASPFVRGLTGQQVLILIDGIRLNNSTFRAGANQYFNTIDPGQVQQIEVIRGPQSALWGSDAIGGVINVVTRSPEFGYDPYGDVEFQEYFSTADTGSYSRGNLVGWVGSTGMFGGASYLNVNDLDRGGDLGRQPFTNYDQYAGDIKFNHLLDDQTLLTVALQHFEQQDVPRSDRFPPFALGPPVGTVRPTFFDPQQRDLAYLRLEGLADGWITGYSVTASYHQQIEGATEIRSPTQVDEGKFTVGSTGLQCTLASDLDALGIFTYGADWYHDDVDSFKNRFNPVAGTVAPQISQFPTDSFYERLGLFLHYDVMITDRLNATAGVRYEMVDLGGTPIVVVDPPGAPPPVNVPTHISPSFNDWVASTALAYELVDGLKLVGSFSEGFRPPNLDDLVATNTLVQQAGLDIPSIDLGPEHSYTYETGLKLDTPRLRSQCFVFWTDLEDAILRTPVAAGLFQRNNRDAYINGVEWYGEYLMTTRWGLYGNFAYTYGKDLERVEPLSRIPPTQGILGSRWRTEDHRTWIDLYAWLVREQDRINFQDFTDARIPVGGTPAFQTLNLRLGHTLGRRHNHQLSLTLENLFDQGYRVHGSGVDGPGFNAIFGYGFVN
jgi:outer membrane receptor protein involved in Fe transport